MAATVSTPGYLRRAGRRSRPVSDVPPGTPAQTGFGVVECLGVKGFCVIADFVPGDTLGEAQAAVAQVTNWTQTPLLVQQGLLGEEGSNRIAKVPMLEPTTSEPPKGDGLAGIDFVMWQLANAITPFQEELGFNCSERGETILHEATYPDVTDVDLIDEDADKWCGVFTTHKIVIILFLGPGQGVLELQPYDLEALPTELKTEPGLVVVLRTDQLSYTYYNNGSDTSYAASCFMTQADIMRMHPSKVTEHMVPAARDLHDYIHRRLQEIKESEPEDPEWIDIQAPRHWVHAANRMIFKQQIVDLCSASCRLPATWEAMSFYVSALSMGLDTAMEVPYTRWDHEAYLGPEPTSLNDPMPKTDCRHGAFVDGLELFDHKLFMVSPQEVRDMDPGQRACMEVTYDALYQTGWRQNTGNLSCAMFVGHGTSEWQDADRAVSPTLHTVTSGAASICAGRLSFVLGCKGPSMAIDTDQASSLSAVWWACESIQSKGRSHKHDLSCGIGVHLILARVMWLAHAQRGDFSPVGRCRTFDRGADGFTPADGVGCATLRARKEVVDGEEVLSDRQTIGTIVGGASNNSGRGSSLSAPHGTSMQEAVIDALVASSIMPSDVDVVECHGTSRASCDYIEAIAAGSALRNWLPEEQGTEGVLNLGSSKSLMGNSIEMAGLSGLLKTMYSIRWGIILANLHLRQLNRHLNMLDRRCETLAFATEHVEQSQGASDSRVFAGVTAFGWGGTNVHLQVFGGIDDEVRPPPPPLSEEWKPRLTYWPGGGGDLGAGGRPRTGYFVTGTFNNWGQGVQMRFEGSGCHSFVLTLGENRWEQFQILIDNDPAKVLHPRQYKALAGTEVFGPDELPSRESTWLLDGFAGTSEADAEEGGRLLPPGMPGDRYSVQLHVAGKWRTVTWTKLGAAELTAGAGAADALVPVSSAAYYSVRGSWNDYADLRMEPDPATPGRHTLELELRERTNCFTVVRNGDWAQAIFPSAPYADAGCSICGPTDVPDPSHDCPDGLEWCLRGKPGERYRIEFRRTLRDGVDTMQLEWHRI